MLDGSQFIQFLVAWATLLSNQWVSPLFHITKQHISQFSLIMQPQVGKRLGSGVYMLIYNVSLHLVRVCQFPPHQLLYLCDNFSN
ncbi:Uncharacterised protein [Mycobacteroides abscessus subsp. abscessus]|nr:Uncharacterised protein [Mycobacteroides abscessus subsp. abscessus]